MNIEKLEQKKDRYKDLEEIIDGFCKQTKLEWEVEYAAIPNRKYRWDYAVPALRVLFEVNGGIFTRGGHSTGTGIQRDYDKLNLATNNGYVTIILTPKNIKENKELIINILINQSYKKVSNEFLDLYIKPNNK